MATLHTVVPSRNASTFSSGKKNVRGFGLNLSFSSSSGRSFSRLLSFRATSRLSVALIAALVLAGWAGLLDTPLLAVRQRTEPLVFWYLPFRGRITSIPASFSKLALCAQSPLAEQLTLGVYFDDPAALADPATMRYWLGFVGEKNPSCGELRQWRGVLGETLEATLPWRHALSPALGPSRAYPALKKKALERGQESLGAPLELYDSAAGTISYLVPHSPLGGWEGPDKEEEKN